MRKVTSRQPVTPDHPSPPRIPAGQSAPVRRRMLQRLIDHIHQCRAVSVSPGEGRKPLLDRPPGVLNLDPPRLLLTPDEIMFFDHKMSPGGQSIHSIQRPPVKPTGLRLYVAPFAGILRGNLFEKRAKIG